MKHVPGSINKKDLQSDVFGGGMGMTGKFWNMYKGATSYDSFDDTDGTVMDEITDTDDDMMEGDGESVGQVMCPIGDKPFVALTQALFLCNICVVF